MADYEGGGGYRKACRSCGRQFVEESLVKHEPICMKNANKKRKVFDTTKMRVDGTDINLRQAKKAAKQPEISKKNNWRAKHADFINAVRSAKQVDIAIANGGPLPPPPPPSLNPDYVQCQYCDRRFNEKAAERHIVFCKEQQARKGTKPQPSAMAKAKMDARNSYQVPKPKGRGATGTSPGVSPMGQGTARTPTSRSSPGVNKAPAGRTPSGTTTAGSGYGRQAQPATRGRSTGGHSTQYNGRENTDLSEGIISPGQAPGRSLRTGRDNKSLYQEAKMDMRPGVLNPKSASRGRIEGPGSRYGNSPINDFNGGFLNEVDNGYNSNNYGSDHGPSHYSNSTNLPPPKFCYECGTKYPVVSAKFCCECGTKRVTAR